MIDLFEEVLQKNITCRKVTSKDISVFEELMDVIVPPSYRNFILQFGALLFEDIAIAGLGVSFGTEVSLPNMLKSLRQVYSQVDQDIIPFRLVAPNQFHCLLSQKDKIHDSPVYLLDAETNTLSKPISEDFTVYLEDLLRQHQYRDIALRTLEKRIDDFDRDFLQQEKLPRNHVWRPYRFCTQDVLIGAVVVKISQEDNSLDVDVCLSSELAEFEPYSSIKMVLIFLFSEAYKCGGTMQIRFTPNVERGFVPKAICDYARALNITLGHVSEGIITSEEAREFYITLTDFPLKVQTRIKELILLGQLVPERLCFMIHHNIWSYNEVEMILFGTDHPDSIFRGETTPNDQLLFLCDLFPSRNACLGSILDRKLLYPNQQDADGATVVLEDDGRDIEVDFNKDYLAKVYYSSSEDIVVPWLIDDRQLVIPTGQRFWVLVRARNTSDLSRNFYPDIVMAKELRQNIMRDSDCFDRVFILTPDDFYELPKDIQEEYKGTAQNQFLEIMVCPDNTTVIDSIVYQRFVNSRIIRS